MNDDLGSPSAACRTRRWMGVQGGSVRSFPRPVVLTPRPSGPSRPSSEFCLACFARLTCAALVACGTPPAAAAPITTSLPGWQLRWDHSLRYSLGWRLERIDPAFGNDPAYDEGEYRFRRGELMTHRLDLLSEFDAIYQQRHGLRISAAGWYDAAYSSRVRTHPGELSLDGSGAGPTLPWAALGSYQGNRYSRYTRRYHRAGAELLDAFVFTGFDLGSMPVTLKLGRHTVYWGESLFTAFHGIAYAQSPLDGLKSASSPGITAKEAFLPLPQISAQAQLNPRLSIAAQYLLSWRPNRLPEGGTYFAASDLLFSGPDRAFLGFAPGGFPLFMPRGPALEPASKRGDWGLAIRWSPAALGDGTLGLYARRFDEKQPWAPLLRLSPQSPLPLDYHLAYARNTALYGLSFTTTVAGASVGAEISHRRHTALNSTTATVVPPTLLDFEGSEGARGHTWHALLNGIWALPQTAWWDAGSLQAELVYSRLQRVTRRPEVYRGIGHACPPGQGVDQGCATRSVWLLQIGFEPQWLQALPGVDIALPVSLALGLRGNGATLAGGNEGAASYSLGVRFDVKNQWQAALRFNDSHARAQRENGRVTGSNGNAAQNDHGWVSLSFAASF